MMMMADNSVMEVDDGADATVTMADVMPTFGDLALQSITVLNFTTEHCFLLRSYIENSIYLG